MAKKQKKVLDWQKKRNDRLKAYNKVLKASRAEFKKQGYDIDYKEARKYVSANIWPVFREFKSGQIKTTDVRRFANKAISWAEPVLPDDNFIDPRTIGEDEISAINWFDIDKYLEYEIRSIRSLQSMTKDLRLQVIGGPYGNSDEFTLNSYNYDGSGVRAIVEAIRRESPYSESEPYASFEGFLASVKGATDPNDKNSYQIQLILIDGTQPVAQPEPIKTAPQQKMTKEELAIMKKREKEMEAARKEFKEAQRRKNERRTAKRPTQKKKSKHSDTDLPKLDPKMSKEDKLLVVSRIKLRELEILRSDYDDGIITVKEYKLRQNRIQRKWEQAIDKLQKGGVI